MAQDTGKYWFTLETECGRQLPVDIENYGGRDFDGNIEYQMSVIGGGPIVTFTINTRRTVFAAATGIIGEVDVAGKFGAYLTDFSIRRDGRDIAFSYELRHEAKYPIYDYLMEAGV